MGSVVLTILSVFLGVFFVLMGAIKVSQRISGEMHREIRQQFTQYAKVVPMASAIGVKVSPKHYRLAIGWLEVIAGLSLAFIPVRRVKLLANFALLFITTGSIYNQIMISDKFERIAPSIVFTLMLCCRLIVSFQVKRREDNLQKSLTDLKKDN